ncbi:MAG TPA: GAP family protein [Trebonia sp.]|nr:GAP family protein [Trebonia sp.]
MIAQAAGFAILAAISPTALLVMVMFLGSANPRATALAYVAGAMLMTVLMAVTVLLVLRGIGLNQPRQRDPRYGLRLGLGVVALATAIVMLRRRRDGRDGRDGRGGRGGRPEADGQQPQGLIGRLTGRPRPGLAFAAGIILFLPSATFVAAVQVIATANASVTATALALATVVVISALIAWLPLLTYLAVPEATVRLLRTFNGWLRAHGRTAAAWALLAGGIVLIGNGSLGVAGAV